MKAPIRLALALLAIGAALGMTVYSFNMLRGQVLDSIGILLEDSFLAAVSVYLLFFLTLLIVRYAVLILYSFLEHMESMFKRHKTPTLAERDDVSLPMITVVIPAYNEGPVIQPALRALLQLDYPNFEVLVVDDGSTDDTYAKASAIALESRHISIRVIHKKNAGKAEALNEGMAQARGEFVLNMDGDTKLSRNTLRACVRHFDDPQVGAVAGNVKILNRENLLTRMQALEYVEGLALSRKAQSFMRVINIIPGPLGMFRKSVLQQVGGYPNDTFAEDCDMTLNILLKDWHIIYEPTAIAWVETPSGLLDLLKQRYRWTRGILQTCRKHRVAAKAGAASATPVIIWYMLFEGIVWPISNFLGSAFFIFIALKYGIAILLFYWWLQLTALDLVAAAYCVILEEEEPSLILYSFGFRLFYIPILDVAKTFASIDEWRVSPMNWGKLKREGKL